MADITQLKPKVRALCERFIGACKENGITVVITQTYRSIDEQNALYAIGRTKPGKIITKARGGYSFHNYRVAFDFCPVVDGKLAWDNEDLFTTCGHLGMRYGLEWGGTWKTITDRPHLQFTAGYTISDFRSGKIDWSKFETGDAKIVKFEPVKRPTASVTAKSGLNIRSGPGTNYLILGKLANGMNVQVIEQRIGWAKIDSSKIVGWVSSSFLSTP